MVQAVRIVAGDAVPFGFVPPEDDRAMVLVGSARENLSSLFADGAIPPLAGMATKVPGPAEEIREAAGTSIDTTFLKLKRRGDRATGSLRRSYFAALQSVLWWSG